MIIRITSIAAKLVACSALLLGATPAAAVDGEILINQAKVNAGGVTPGDTAGFPATLSRPGRYKLAGNIVVPSSIAGLYVTANDVSIDLNGFTIRGIAPGYVGVLAAAGSDRLRVMNGTLIGFDGSNGRAIDGLGSRNSVVENARVVGNTIGIYGLHESQIRNNTIAGNGYGVYNCVGCVIKNNIVTDSTEVGIVIANDALVLGNVIAANTGYGLDSNAYVGYGNNILVDNNGGGAQVSGILTQLHPNVCHPACP